MTANLSPTLPQPLTDEIVTDLKKKYPSRALYSITLADRDFVYTHLLRDDVREFYQWLENNRTSNITNQDVEDKVVSMGLVWPQLSPVDWSIMPAGVLTTLSNLIQEASYIDLWGTGIDFDVSSIPLSDYEQDPPVPEDVITKVKKQYPGEPLRQISVCGKNFIVRPIKRLEFNPISRAAIDGQIVDTDLEVARKCTVYPDSVNWERLVAGIPAVLARVIMDISGFMNTENPNRNIKKL